MYAAGIIGENAHRIVPESAVAGEGVAFYGEAGATHQFYTGIIRRHAWPDGRIRVGADAGKSVVPGNDGIVDAPVFDADEVVYEIGAFNTEIPVAASVCSEDGGIKPGEIGIRHRKLRIEGIYTGVLRCTANR